MNFSHLSNGINIAFPKRLWIRRSSHLNAIVEIISRSLPSGEHSLRGLASIIGIDPGQLSRIFQGKRRVTLQTAMALIASIEISDDDAKKLIQLVVAQEVGEKFLRIQEQLMNSPLLNPRVKRSLQTWCHEFMEALSDGLD